MASAVMSVQGDRENLDEPSGAETGLDPRQARRRPEPDGPKHNAAGTDEGSPAPPPGFSEGPPQPSPIAFVRLLKARPVAICLKIE